MSERENDSPSGEPEHNLGDLFANLPDPSREAPTVDDTPPAPGSRRAVREAAARRDPGSSTPALADIVGQTPERGSEPIAATAPVDIGATPSVAAEATGADVPRPQRGLEDLFHAESHEETAVVSAAKKKKRRRGCLIALIVILAIFGGIAAAGVAVWNAYGDKISDALGWGDPADWEPGLATGEVVVTIQSGDTGRPVSTTLFEAGVTRTEDVFYDYLVAENPDVTFYPGNYLLQEKMTAEAALTALQDPSKKLENTARVGEGATVVSSLPGIAESLGLPLEELQAAVADPAVYGVSAQNLEGWLFPAVYTFDPGVTAQQVIQRMVDRTRESLAAAGVPDEEAERILTIASIIQREGLTADFPKVSRVIQNRLDIDMKLQMDSTAQYGYGSLHEGVVSSSAEALEDPNEWNTYYHTGLPVTPIASPSDAAIDAAMHPADGPWLYFVTINLATGETQFSVTYEEHLQGVQKWDQWCRDNPDGGCSAG